MGGYPNLASIDPNLLRLLTSGGSDVSSVGAGGYGAFDPQNAASYLDMGQTPALQDAMNSYTPQAIQTPEDVASAYDTVARVLPSGLAAEPGGTPQDPSSIPPWLATAGQIANPLNILALPFRGIGAVRDTIRGALGKSTLEDQATGAAQALRWAENNQIPGSGALPDNVQTLVDRTQLGPQGKAYGVNPQPANITPDIGSRVLGFLTGDTVGTQRDTVAAAAQLQQRILQAHAALQQQGMGIGNEQAQQKLSESYDLWRPNVQEKQAEASIKMAEDPFASAYYNLRNQALQRVANMPYGGGKPEDPAIAQARQLDIQRKQQEINQANDLAAGNLTPGQLKQTQQDFINAAGRVKSVYKWGGFGAEDTDARKLQLDRIGGAGRYDPDTLIPYTPEQYVANVMKGRFAGATGGGSSTTGGGAVPSPTPDPTASPGAQYALPTPLPAPSPTPAPARPAPIPPALSPQPPESGEPARRATPQSVPMTSPPTAGQVPPGNNKASSQSDVVNGYHTATPTAFAADYKAKNPDWATNPTRNSEFRNMLHALKQALGTKTNEWAQLRE